MSEDIQTLLDGLVSPERIETLTQVNGALDELDYDAHLFEIKQIASMYGVSADADMTVARVDDAITIAVWDCLSRLGIVVVDSPIAEFLPVLLTVTYWNDYVLPDILYGIVESADSNEEAFARIVEELTDTPYERILETLEKVDDSVVKTILDHTRPIFSDDVIASEEDLVKRRQAVRNVNALLSVAPRFNEEYIVKRLAETGTLVGVELKTILPDIIRTLDRRSPIIAGWELALLYQYTDSPFASLTEFLKDFIEDPSDLASVTSTLESAHVPFNKG